MMSKKLGSVLADLRGLRHLEFDLVMLLRPPAVPAASQPPRTFEVSQPSYPSIHVYSVLP